MRLIPTSLQIAVRPRLACEIAPEAVFAAQSDGQESPLQAAFCVPLQQDALAPGWKSPVLSARDAIRAALERALEGIVGRSKQLTLIVPDACVRVLVLDFDALPNKPQEAQPLIRFRLRKMLPFDAETAAVSYQVLKTNREVEKVGSLRVMVAATSAEVRAEFEVLIREAGFEPGVLLPSTLAALAAVPETGAHLVVHTGQRSVTTAISQSGDLLLYRTVERAAQPAGGDNTDGFEDDLVQAILVATAFYEDSLGSVPEQIWVAGHDTPEDLQARMSVDGVWQIPMRSLVQTEHFLAEARTAGIPACRFAGVVGALHG
ncbi:MAG TPA: hypothetical protein VHX63_15395 [Acidobacteriaceae bacterium]|jgi:type IV pilus assembly protein PilM|nr:hypothetical protein [Acidobacteriaceae bacterium]